MPTATYQNRRGQLETYFDRTAFEAWARMTSDVPLSGIRATVRAGRDTMRQTLLDWLPADMRGARLLDAGCGTGALAVEAARRGADVLAVDISPSLIRLAQERIPPALNAHDPQTGADQRLQGGRIEFCVGDMLNPEFGRFDYVVAMDSLIHYRASDIGRVVGALAERTGSAVLFTFAPRTALLSIMHAAGRLIPNSDRAPAIEPVAEKKLRRILEPKIVPAGGKLGRTHRVASGFYTSQALEVLGA
jgi:magnesium-protoporphyrin O-methyltransferase